MSTAFPLQAVRTPEPFSSVLHTRFQGRDKRGRGKAVSWLPEDQICQIRFFLSNDAPSALRSAQAVFQSYQSSSLLTQNGCMDGSLDITPGFHGSLAKRARVNTVVEASISAGTQWFSPQKVVHACEWLVACGDESNEVALQKQRELRVLEAFYPRFTSVPDSPAEPVEYNKHLDDNDIPIIPLVPIEDEDESGEGPEHCVKEDVEADMAMTDHLKLNDEQRPQLPNSGFITHSSQDSSEHSQDPTISKVDSEVASAAAAACMAIQKCGASSLVDHELLVEILRNPALLRNFNASLKDSVGAMNGTEVGGIVGHSNRNPHNVNQYGGPVNKAPFNTGLPSPVSVLSDWTQEHSTKFLSRALSNASDTASETSNAKNVSSCVPTNLPFGHSHGTYPLRENAMHMESISAPLQGVHAFTQESQVGIKRSLMSNNASAQKASVMHVDRSCGMLAPLAPCPLQNATKFNSSTLGRIQPSHVAPHVGVMYDSAPCRSSFPDARPRGLQNENAGLGSMSKTGPKATKLCLYFNTARGCWNGGKCAFLHQLSKQELNTTAQ